MKSPARVSILASVLKALPTARHDILVAFAEVEDRMAYRSAEHNLLVKYRNDFLASGDDPESPRAYMAKWIDEVQADAQADAQADGQADAQADSWRDQVAAAAAAQEFFFPSIPKARDVWTRRARGQALQMARKYIEADVRQNIIGALTALTVQHESSAARRQAARMLIDIKLAIRGYDGVSEWYTSRSGSCALDTAEGRRTYNLAFIEYLISEDQL